MATGPFPKLEREPVLEEALPPANPPVGLVKGESASRRATRRACIDIPSPPAAWSLWAAS
jgi:hypothetical protein